MNFPLRVCVPYVCPIPCTPFRVSHSMYVPDRVFVPSRVSRFVYPILSISHHVYPTPYASYFLFTSASFPTHCVFLTPCMLHSLHSSYNTIACKRSLASITPGRRYTNKLILYENDTPNLAKTRELRRLQLFEPSFRALRFLQICLN